MHNLNKKSFLWHHINTSQVQRRTEAVSQDALGEEAEPSLPTTPQPLGAHVGCRPAPPSHLTLLLGFFRDPIHFPHPLLVKIKGEFLEARAGIACLLCWIPMQKESSKIVTQVRC